MQQISSPTEGEKSPSHDSVVIKAHTSAKETTFSQNRYTHQTSQDQGEVYLIAEESAALVIVHGDEKQKDFGNQILVALDANRFKVKAVKFETQELPFLVKGGEGLYSIIIFQNLLTYINLREVDRSLIDGYCQRYKVGIVAFTGPSLDNEYSMKVGNFPLVMDKKMTLKDLSLNSESPVFHITKTKRTLSGILPGEDWTVFRSNHSTYQSIALAKTRTQDMLNLVPDSKPILHTTVIHDLGHYDGIQRVLFGSDFTLWLHYILFLDSVRFLSGGRLSVDLKRYILVDVDDIFVGSAGIRMKRIDVEAMLVEQDILAKLVPGFRFNLGFSGKFFQRGTDEENLGDERLLKHADKFWWFPHMWNHMQPHKYNSSSKMIQDMKKNKQFAQDNWIPVHKGYAVAPHHSGVYPVQEELYSSWKSVWQIEATSTEEYPHLRPSRNRRGFIHKGIMVIPRQTCGLFTHTNFFREYPGGRSRLDKSINGGELFRTVINTPFYLMMQKKAKKSNRFMCSGLDKYPTCNSTPVETAKKYFEIFPKEKDPLWRNPCEDSRHLEIWSSKKSCSKLPQLVVVGPQKTGTTALYSFLSLHPYIRSNLPSEKTFEELQFFSGPNYNNGLDWYMKYFPGGKNNSDQYRFEKSATYFDSPYAATRVHALLPTAKIIAILTNPANRSYSWYQHMKVHEDKAALNHSFYEVITAGSDSGRSVKSLQKRCLEPGKYATHLYRWLKYFPKQILIIDGNQLRDDPVSVMSKVQRFIGIQPRLDYKHFLRYDSRKGFFCIIKRKGKSECLGKSKGRIYPPMEPRAVEYLNLYYRQHNLQLHSLLENYGLTVPDWLVKDLARPPQG
ncbi:putative bifunctional heparan sulfate N-deacetylase/N-sulfotransferase-like [Apostichopus japonicus]|uniref:[heparan sulfate]-glucosamine N-sulfotransferase n=1 Tax=Stichopus japonicus TaxID=307972 RepID=A0A2G8KXX9_STIJA|nr:putative bifunctional heparan sulfate N-deacetylase/N-sulfotransferase-like [Apostichopus japonicus]